VFHHREGLAFGLEAGDDLPRVHAELDDLEGDLALDGLGLVRGEDDAETTLAEAFEKVIAAAADVRALRGVGLAADGVVCRADVVGEGFDAEGGLVAAEEEVDQVAQGTVVAAMSGDGLFAGGEAQGADFDEDVGRAFHPGRFGGGGFRHLCRPASFRRARRGRPASRGGRSCG
jgi:hypothetical protein